VSLSLNPRLMARKPPACKVDTTSLQETDLSPEAAERARAAAAGRVEACAPDGNGNPPARHVEIA